MMGLRDWVPVILSHVPKAPHEKRQSVAQVLSSGPGHEPPPFVGGEVMVGVRVCFPLLLQVDHSLQVNWHDVHCRVLSGGQG